MKRSIGIKNMKRSIGIRFPDQRINNIDYLKKEILFFDEIAIPDATNFVEFYLEDCASAELEYLLNKGIVRDTSHYINQSGLSMQEIEDLRNSAMVYERQIWQKERTDPNALFGMVALADTAINSRIRADALIVGKVPSMMAIPIFSTNNYNIASVATKQTEVLQIILRNMPLPSPHLSWEHLIDFHKNPEARKRRNNLKRWISLISSGEKHLHEIEDELEAGLDAYEEYMKIQKIKYEYGIFETLVTTTAEVLENILKLRIGKLARLPFEISKKRIDLLDAELKAPGREFSYISYIRARL